MDSPVNMNEKTDQQILQEMIRFESCPDTKNFIVTGGNGFCKDVGGVYLDPPFFLD